MKSRRVTCVILAFILSLSLGFSCWSLPASAADKGNTEYWPTKGWKLSSPEKQGMDSGILTDMLKAIEKKKALIQSVIVIRNGYLVMEAYFPPFKKDTKHQLFSCTKSINAAALGIAINEGYIKGIDQKVLDFFPEYEVENMSPEKADRTIRNLLMMSSGILNSDNALSNSNDRVGTYLNLPLDFTPGSRFSYDNGASHMLSAITQKATGKTTFEYAKEKIFNPLGIKDVAWPADTKGISMGSGGVQMMPLDMAKFGYLFLKNGKWDGRQIVPEQWVKDSTKKYLENPNEGNRGYGYQWWINRKVEGFNAHGMRGQRIFVLPKHDIVVVFTASDSKIDSEDLLNDYIVPAVKSQNPLPESAAKLAGMNNQIKKMSTQTAKAVPTMPDTAKSISGKKFKINPGNVPIQEVSFEFTGKNQSVMTTLEDNVKCRYTIGLDDVYRKNLLPNGRTVWCKGYWLRKNFIVRSEVIENGDTYDTIYMFDGSKVTITRKDLSNNGITSTTGTMVK